MTKTTARVYADEIEEGDTIEWAGYDVPVLRVEHFKPGVRTYANGRLGRVPHRGSVYLTIRTHLDERRCHWYPNEVITRVVQTDGSGSPG